VKKLLAVVVLIFVAAAAALLLMRGNAPDEGPSAPAAPVKVRVAYQPYASNAPLYAAVERGYFAKEGVEVELIKFRSSSTMMPAFLAGETDVATGSSIDILAAATKFPGSFRIYRTGYATKDHCSDAFVVKKGAPYKSLAEFKDKKMGTFPGAATAMYAHVLFDKVLGDRDAIKLVPMSPALLLDALGSGSVDVAWILEPMGMLGEEKGACQYLEKGPMTKYVLDPSVSGFGIIAQSFIDKHPAAARAYVKAFTAGVMDVRADRKAVAAYLPKYTKLSKEVAHRVPYSDSRVGEEYPIEAIEALVDLLMKEKVLDSRPDIKSLRYGE